MILLTLFLKVGYIMKESSSFRLIPIPSFRILAFFLFFLIAPFCLLSQAAVITVPGDYSTIQAAIDAADDGDEIIVSQGTYYENISFLGKNIILRSTEPTSATVVASTIIDANQAGSVVTFSGTELTTCVLSGFTIANGYALDGGGIYGNRTLATVQHNMVTSNTVYYIDWLYVGGSGGGLYRCNGTIEKNIISGNIATGTRSYGGGLCNCDGNIRNNIVSGNSSDSYGGGLYDCSGTIENNTISDNLAHFGGGLYYCNSIIRNNKIHGNIVYGRNSAGGGLRECQGTIQNNIISENLVTHSYPFGSAGAFRSYRDSEQTGTPYGSAPPFIPNYRGGGLSECNGTIVNNLVSGNAVTGDYGNGGGLADCNGTIQNNTIYGNTAKNGGGLAECRGFIINCIFWANSATFGAQVHDSSTPFYSCVEDWSADGIGNISTDPQFNDAANGNFHITADSPCIDAGNKFYLFGDYIADIDGECRIAGSSVDIGCDEYNSSPDSDGDLLTYLVELTQGSDPNNPDTDGDGLQDGMELFRGTDPTFSNTPSGISIPADYTSVQQGIFLAFPAEEITVSPGSYYENLHFLIKNLILQSIDPLNDDIVSSTTIDGNASFSVIFFTGAENESCVIRGLTLRNGSAPYGGGICGNRTLATIENSRIVGNSALLLGGGLYQCDGIIQKNIICSNLVTNDSGHGGGVEECNGIIQNNIIAGNSARGGGMVHCNGAIQNNTIYGNLRGCGLYECKGSIKNCIVWQHRYLEVFYCAQPTYSCIQSWTGGGTGNISSDPELVDPDNGDFNLQASSPCIDAGCYINGISQDFEGDLRPWDGTPVPRGDGSDFDIGADEFTGPVPTPIPTPCIIYVPIDYSTIQAAIDAAQGGCEIIVSPGTYYENINFGGKNIVLRSTDPASPSVVANTIINANGSGSVVTFSGTETPICVLSGFTITNGNGPEGGGICGKHTVASIQNNTISSNTASYGGGLSWFYGTIRNNTIFGNEATFNGGGLDHCTGRIYNNTISGNWAGQNGGGLYDCQATIQNNIIIGNTAAGSWGNGGGLCGCSGAIQNNIVSGNWAAHNGGGLWKCYGTIQNNTIYSNWAGHEGGGLYGSCTIKNCIFWQNSAPTGAQIYGFATPYYSCIQDGTDRGMGNISSDPQFVDSLNGDFHLLPSSPCIDAGCIVANLTQDFEGDPRPMDGTSEARGDGSDFDIGADEFPGAFALREYNFDLTEEGWGLVEISHFTPPSFDYTSGKLILTAQDNTNTYGFWTSELDAVPVIADCLYRARWTVATDVTDALAVPSMLLRINSQNYQQADMLVVSSAGDGSYAPTPEGRTYEIYFVPPDSALGKPEDQDDLILSFDIMNFDAGDAADGSLMLDRVVVEAIPLDTLSTPTVLKTWTFETDSEGWEFGSIPLFTAPLSGVGAGALWLIAQNNTNTFGFWSGPSEAVEMEEGKLYRLRFTVSTDVMVQENVPQLRLRVSSEDFQSSIVKVISSLTGAEMSPTSEGRTYDLYFYPPQSLVATTQTSLPAAFDILNFDPGDSASGALMLDGVVVESFDVVP